MTKKAAPGTQMAVTLPKEIWNASETRALSKGRDLSGLLAAALSLYLRSSRGREDAPEEIKPNGNPNYGKGRLFLRSSTYWTAIWAPGPGGKWRESRETTRTDDETKARQILEERIRKSCSIGAIICAIADSQRDRRLP